MESIRAHGLYPTQIVEAGKGKIQQTPAAKKKAKGGKKQKGRLGGRIKAKALMIFTRQLATLIDAGLPLLPELERAGQAGGEPQPRVTLKPWAIPCRAAPPSPKPWPSIPKSLTACS